MANIRVMTLDKIKSENENSFRSSLCSNIPTLYTPLSNENIATIPNTVSHVVNKETCPNSSLDISLVKIGVVIKEIPFEIKLAIKKAVAVLNPLDTILNF